MAMADKIRLLIVGAAIALTFVFCAEQTYMSFMWMKFWITIAAAGVYGAWKGFNGERLFEQPQRSAALEPAAGVAQELVVVEEVRSVQRRINR